MNNVNYLLSRLRLFPSPTGSRSRDAVSATGANLWLGPPPITAFPRGTGVISSARSSADDSKQADAVTGAVGLRDSRSDWQRQGSDHVPAKGLTPGVTIFHGTVTRSLACCLSPLRAHSPAEARLALVFHLSDATISSTMHGLDEALGCLVPDHPGSRAKRDAGEGGARAEAGEDERQGQDDVNAAQGSASKTFSEDASRSTLDNSRPKPRGLPLALPPKDSAAAGPGASELEQGDESLALSSSNASSLSQSSQSWTFPAYDAPASPSLSGSLSAGPSPHKSEFRSGYKSDHHSSATSQELDSILGTFGVFGASTGRAGAKLSAMQAMGPVGGLGKGREASQERCSRDGYDSGYSSLISSLQSLSEIGQSAEFKEEKRGRIEEARQEGAAGDGGVRLSVAEAERSMEEARELQGLSSLRGSDDLLAARLREQQERQQGLQQSLDARLSRLETLAAAQLEPGVPTSSARSSTTSLGNTQVSLSATSSKLQAAKPAVALADHPAHWLQGSATRQSRESAASVDSDSSRGQTPPAVGSATLSLEAAHRDSSFSSQYHWKDELSGNEDGQLGERRATEGESAEKAGRSEADVIDTRPEPLVSEQRPAAKKDASGQALELSATRLAELGDAGREDARGGREGLRHVSEAPGFARDEVLEGPGARRARGGVAWEVFLWSASVCVCSRMSPNRTTPLLRRSGMVTSARSRRKPAVAFLACINPHHPSSTSHQQRKPRRHAVWVPRLTTACVPRKEREAVWIPTASPTRSFSPMVTHRSSPKQVHLFMSSSSSSSSSSFCSFPGVGYHPPCACLCEACAGRL